MSLKWTWIAAVSCVLLNTAPAAADDTAQPAFMSTPAWLGEKYVANSQWAELETLIQKLAQSGERADDGRFQLYLVSDRIRSWLELWDENEDRLFRGRFAEYREKMPDSAFAPILAAMQVHAAAWRARGRGFSSTVTREGWALFRERNEQAWKMMQACKSQSASLATWYEQALTIGMDASVAPGELKALFEEGIKRFPGYHSLYFSYARQFSPRWGGDYKAADAFIKAQVAAKTNPDGEMLYARLYWLLDQYGGGDQDFFDDSLVDWSRMRAGFQKLLKAFPNSAWNQANYVAFACRAGDAREYFKWRNAIDTGQFKEAAPAGISLEVCDARFTQKA
jgi:hypothetical protein